MVTTKERSLHGQQHQRGAADLGERAHQGPEPKASVERGKRRMVSRHHPDQEQQREGKAEQETHLGRARRAQARRQLALHGVARGLARRARRW